MVDENMFDSIKFLFLESLRAEIVFINDFLNHVSNNDFFGIKNKELTSLSFIVSLFEKRASITIYIKDLENSSLTNENEILKGTLLLEFIKNK